MSILSFFRKSAPSAPFTGDDAARMKLYKKRHSCKYPWLIFVV